MLDIKKLMKEIRNSKADINEILSYGTYEIDDNIFDNRSRNSLIKATPIKKEMPYSKFEQMRNIGKGRQSFKYIDDAELFVKQARFMVSFIDNYEGNAVFEHYYPSYSKMNDMQLRTYFTWRASARRGIVKQTSLSYVFVYIYELINKVGAKDAIDCIGKLIFILKEYSKFDDEITEFLVDWAKDFYICNDFNESFQEIVIKFGVELFYPSIFAGADAEYKYDTLCDVSGYKFEESEFYTAERKELVGDCFDKTIANLIPLFDVYGISIDDIVVGAIETQNWWEPFKGVPYSQEIDVNKTVNIAPNEKYIIKDGSWTAHKPSNKSAAPSIIFGYIIKKIETELRVFTNYKYKLLTEISVLVENMQNRYNNFKHLDVVISDPLFDEIISETASNCFGQTDENDTLMHKVMEQINTPNYLLFKEMRNSKKIVAINDYAKRFYMRAKLLEKVEDNFNVNMYCLRYLRNGNSNAMSYTNLTNGQLRTYFTWRTRIRNGDICKTSEEYTKLYFFELINDIGTENELESMQKMANVLKGHTDITKSFEKLLCSWIKDYYICGNFTCSFFEVAKQCGILHYYPNVALEFKQEDGFYIYMKLSSYNIEKSKFYNEKSYQLIKKCFQAVLIEIEKYFIKERESFSKLLNKKAYATNWWSPFKQAIYCEKKTMTPKKVVLCSNEAYSYKHSSWHCDMMPDSDATASHIVGYILKRTEVKMREIMKFKYKLNADISSVTKKITNNYFRLKALLTNPEFDKTIDNAVIEFFKENYPNVFTNPNAPFEKPIEVKIDTSKLEKIRIESGETRDKLTIDEEMEQVIVTNKEVVSQSGNGQGLYASLNKTQIEAIEIILSGTQVKSKLHTLSTANNILTEVLLEGINEIALDFIGDNIIEVAESVPYIYEEYLQEVNGGIVKWKK